MIYSLMVEDLLLSDIMMFMSIIDIYQMDMNLCVRKFLFMFYINLQLLGDKPLLNIKIGNFQFYHMKLVIIMFIFLEDALDIFTPEDTQAFDDVKTYVRENIWEFKFD